MSFVAILASVDDVDAWGCLGHIIIGQIAGDSLTEIARTRMRELLEGRSLAEVSCWADEVRHSRPETRRWHYVDIPRLATTYDPGRDCIPLPEGDCLVAAILRDISVLNDASASRSERAEALRFLVHFVGDLHQPLHCTDDHDRGGNEIPVLFQGSRENLHSVWDTSLINALLASDLDLAAHLRKSAQHATPLRQLTIEEWALESHAVAAHLIYARLPADKLLDARYIDAHRPVLERQLIRAGLRLATVINRIFDPTQSEAGHAIRKPRDTEKERQ